MSKAATTEQEVPETVVRNRSQYADTLHRQGPESDAPEPACPTRESKKEYTAVPSNAYLGHYESAEIRSVSGMGVGEPAVVVVRLDVRLENSVPTTARFPTG